jgi:hypothetical protein
MVIEVRPLQLQNAELPMLVTELGIVIEVRLKQLENASPLTLVTELGIDNEPVSPVQLKKALYPIEVTL